MTLAHSSGTIPAYPCGRPADRERFGMTPALAILYADLVAQHGDKPDEPFEPLFRRMAKRLYLKTPSGVHRQVAGLVERGWIEPVKPAHYARAKAYRFVAPVMRFPKVPAVWEIL